MEKARRTRAIIIYEGADITKALENYLVSLTYTDNEEDQADDLQIALEDREGLWLKNWLKQTGKGAEIKAYLLQIDEKQKTKKVNCGKFKVDAINLSGPPGKVSIKATSIPTDSKIVSEHKNKAWEKIKLSAIANEIASKNKLSCMFQSKQDPFYERKEQAKKSDLIFLKELCKDAGISLKITDKKLVLFDAEDFEKKPPVETIEYGKANILRFSFGTSYKDTGYSACEVQYTDPKTKKTIKGFFKNPGENSSEKVLKLNTKVANKSEADELAKKSLREKNKNETKASFEMLGNLIYAAGSVIEIKSFGYFDGKYIIKSANHSISQSGYTTSLTLRKILKGY